MHRKNNFDFVRLLFASFVIITHAYPLSGLDGKGDWLSQITNGQIVFSYVGVKGFFVISGYLIFQSLERSKSLLDYYWKRFLRLFPALLIVLILTIILSPFVYENASIPYIRNMDVWSYIPNNLSLYKTQYYISGIFENNAYKGAINGSLWTIKYEFTMYVILSFLFFFKGNNNILRPILIFLFGFLAIGYVFFFDYLNQFGFILGGGLLLELGSFFIAGSLLASLKIENVKHFNYLTLLRLIIIVLSLILGVFREVTIFTFPILVVYCCVKSTPFINNIGNQLGDLSYGIYIYGFPVQQTLYYYFQSDYIQLMIYGLIISSVLSYFSWHFIEIKALSYKKVFLKK
jgi:peptidoglycan/LPS O-acetylase OafA/YrhL